MVEVIEVRRSADDLIDKVCELLDDKIPVILHGDLSKVKEIMKLARKRGENWLLLIPCPPWEEVENYLDYAERVGKTVEVSPVAKLDKPVSRMELLKYKGKVVLDYPEIPLVDSKCQVMSDCFLCVESCPYKAIIKEKPVKIIADRCAECGICLLSCPSNFIYLPWLNVDVVSKLKMSQVVTLAPLSKLDQVKEGTLIRVPEEGFPLHLILYLLKMKKEIEIIGLDYMKKLVKIIKELPLKETPDDLSIWRVDERSSDEISLLASMLEDIDEWLDTPLNYFTVKVNQGCTLCGSCAQACPTDALKVKEEGQTIMLNFYHYKCVGCNTCIRVCPEEVIEVRRSLNPHLLKSSSSIRVFEDEVATCRKCGRPLGRSVTMNRKLEDKIARTGNVKFAELVWYCDRCKDEVLFKDLM